MIGLYILNINKYSDDTNEASIELPCFHGILDINVHADDISNYKDNFNFDNKELE